MPIGIAEEHEALRQTARRFLESRCPASVPRALLDADEEPLPAFWEELSQQGWLGLHVKEAFGGQGYGVAELTVILEEMGRACAPGPFLTTVLAAALIQTSGSDELQEAVLGSMAEGSVRAAVAFGATPLAGDSNGGGLRISGVLAPVLEGGVAQLLVVPVDIGQGQPQWCVVEAKDVEIERLPSLDPTRPVVSVKAEGVDVSAHHILSNLTTRAVLDLAVVLASAECVGGHGWCLETASSYAKVREQFGRPIGQFQAVKHKLADMLVSLEQAAATTWDAAQTIVVGGNDQQSRLVAGVAASVALDAFAQAAKDCIQVLGGIGFTWEHDAHLYLKRAVATRQLLGGIAPWRQRVAELALGGARRSLATELLDQLPAQQSGEFRQQVAADAVRIKALPREQRRPRLVEGGYIAPHWPPPWGKGASAVEQLVIDHEFQKVHLGRPNLAVGAWALPTIIAYGSPEQQERWVLPTLLGELSWCQMFSEPGAGSDLAGLSTKAAKVEGGWRLSGQKVWTSLAAQADWAICLARTNPSAPKHQGITYFILDMGSEGLDVRPLRELTGAAMFNEVFLSDVFVPDDCVIGHVDDGWRLARTTLANERVSMSSGSSFGGGVEGLLEVVGRLTEGTSADKVVLDQVGDMVAEAQSLALLGHRATLRALSGVEPGPESSVRKLLGVEHEQRVQEFGLSLLGPDGATTQGDAARWTFGFLANRCLTIAGGTSEVQRNLIAERLLGLPRDPEPGD